MNMPKLDYFEYDLQGLYHRLHYTNLQDIIKLGEMLASIVDVVKCPVNKYTNAYNYYDESFIDASMIDDKYKDIRKKYLVYMGEVFNTCHLSLNLNALNIEVWELFTTGGYGSEQIELDILTQNEYHPYAFDKREYIRTSKKVIQVLIDIYLHYKYGKAYESLLSEIVE